MTRRLLALALALAVLGLGGAGASAHPEVPGVRAVVDSVTPPLPGVSVQAAITVSDQLIVDNPTPTDLTVVGEGGEPFLRIGPSGVFANVHSPTWFRSNDPTGTAVAPKDAAASAPPLFAQVATGHSWGWFDPRMQAGASPGTGPPGQPVRLASWAIPLSYGGRAVTVAGHREYRTPRGVWETRVVSAPVRAVADQGLVPGITVMASAGPAVTVLGEGGEPMARLTGSTVEVNEASPTWVFTAEAEGGFQPTGPVGADVPPRWRSRPGNEVTWLDRRAQAVTAAGEGSPGQRQRWSIPVLVGERRDAIAGETSWVASGAAAAPIVPGRSVSPWPVGLAVVAVIAGGIVWAGRKRRGGG